MGEELFTLFIIVVVGAAQLVKFLGKMGKGDEPVQVSPPRQQQRPSGAGQTQQGQRQQEGRQSVKSLLQDALNEISGNRPVQSQQPGHGYKEQQLYKNGERVDYPGITVKTKAVPKETESAGGKKKPKLFSKPNALRQAFIMKEVLDRPVSERM